MRESDTLAAALITEWTRLVLLLTPLRLDAGGSLGELAPWSHLDWLESRWSWRNYARPTSRTPRLLRSDPKGRTRPGK